MNSTIPRRLRAEPPPICARAWKRFRTIHASLMKRSKPNSGSNWSRSPRRPCTAPHLSRNSMPSNKATARKRSNAGSIRRMSRTTWELAPALVNARVDQQELEALKQTVPAQDLENAVHWAHGEGHYTRLDQIDHPQHRAHLGIGARGEVLFIDQAPWQEIDVHEGVENTLTILGHKLRNVTVTRDFDRTLPRLYRQAAAVLQASPNCQGYELIRSDKDTQNYLLTIFWDSAEGHVEGFRKSDLFPKFLELIRPYIPMIQEMEHYHATGVSWRREA